MSIYVIGSKKGLGKYLIENITSVAINRNNFNKIKESKNNIFIICANNKNKYPQLSSVYDFYLDNIDLIKKISNMKHDYIIYMSSIEVYNQHGQTENTDITCNFHNPYSLSKLIAENIIINNSKKYSILRLSALLGKYSNNLISKLIKNNIKSTTLSKNSSFNYILYADVLNLIRELLTSKKKGIYNLISNNNITLEDAVSLTNKKIKFGKYKYLTYRTSNEKIKKISKYFNKSSRRNLKLFINDYY